MMVGGTWQKGEKTWALPSWSPAIVKMMMVNCPHNTSLPKRKAGNRNVALVVVIIGANIVVNNILTAVQTMVP